MLISPQSAEVLLSSVLRQMPHELDREKLEVLSLSKAQVSSLQKLLEDFAARGVRPAVQASPNESEESETEVTSPESRRKPTRRGGRRARHRKLAALARQQAAEAAEAPNAEEAEADYSPPTAGISMVPTLPEAGDRLFSPEVAPSMSSTSSPIYAGLGVATEVDGAQLIGCTVLIQGLVRSPEFNGQWGYVESYDPLMQRYLVSVVLPTQLPGEAPLYAKLRRDNLIVPRPEVHPIPSPVPHLGGWLGVWCHWK
eukprot:symbB.v1.2.004019.t1/scaffold227.1/size261201/5